LLFSLNNFTLSQITTSMSFFSNSCALFDQWIKHHLFNQSLLRIIYVDFIQHYK
jgi:hypothetical protein